MVGLNLMTRDSPRTTYPVIMAAFDRSGYPVDDALAIYERNRTAITFSIRIEFRENHPGTRDWGKHPLRKIDFTARESLPSDYGLPLLLKCWAPSTNDFPYPSRLC